MKAKFSALDVANLFIKLANSIPGDSIDNLKLNKILYFAQGRFLSEKGYPLFSEEIQAWDCGIVVPVVYHTFKCWGKRNIECPNDAFDETKLTSDEISLLLDVYDNYGRYTDVALTEITHRRQYENNTILIPAIKDFFIKDRDFHKFELDFNAVPIITEAPHEWDSPEDSVYDI